MDIVKVYVKHQIINLVETDNNSYIQATIRDSFVADSYFAVMKGDKIEYVTDTYEDAKLFIKREEKND